MDSYYNMNEVKSKQLESHRDMLSMLGDLITPKTQGFDHINLDMSFSYIDRWDKFRLEKLSTVTTYAYLWSLKGSHYILRGNIATILNLSKSFNGRTMRLFTDTTVEHKQSFKDNTQQKRGFSMFPKKQGGD